MAILMLPFVQNAIGRWWYYANARYIVMYAYINQSRFYLVLGATYKYGFPPPITDLFTQLLQPLHPILHCRTVQQIFSKKVCFHPSIYFVMAVFSNYTIYIPVLCSLLLPQFLRWLPHCHPDHIFPETSFRPRRVSITWLYYQQEF